MLHYYSLFCRALLQKSPIILNTSLLNQVIDLSCKSVLNLSCQHMGWLRVVGSWKLYVTFAEYRLFYRALLQNETCNIKEPTTFAEYRVVSL